MTLSTRTFEFLRIRGPDQTGSEPNEVIARRLAQPEHSPYDILIQCRSRCV